MNKNNNSKVEGMKFSAVSKVLSTFVAGVLLATSAMAQIGIDDKIINIDKDLA